MLAAAIEMLVGGVVLLAVAAGSGEFSRIHWSAVPATSWIALAYLIGPGSILAFTAYGYALSHLPVTTVSTYAYVNPVVAVLAGDGKASFVPSGVKATAVIAPSCPLNWPISLPGVTSQIRMEWPGPLHARSEPSGEKASVRGAAGWSMPRRPGSAENRHGR